MTRKAPSPLQLQKSVLRKLTAAALDRVVGGDVPRSTIDDPFIRRTK